MNKIEYERLLKPLIEIYDNIELDLIKDIIERVDNYSGVKGSLEWYIDKLNEIGILDNHTLKILKNNKGSIKKTLEELLKQAGNNKDNFELLSSYYNKGLLDVNPLEIYNSVAINNIINNALEDCDNIMELINTKALEGTRESYKKILNQAYIETASGVYTYTQSINRALNKMAENGITTANYESERHFSIEAVVRRDTLTRVNKLNAEIELQRARELNTNLVYVDQHLGARVRTKYTKHDYEVHAEWQGKKYMIEGSSDEYDNLYEKTGLGEMLGLGGINCRHNMRPTFEWEKVDERIDEVENAKAYEKLQKQREYERKIRKLKRKREVAKATGEEEYNKISNKLKDVNIEFNNWLKDNDSTRDYSREYVAAMKNENLYEDVTQQWLNNGNPNTYEILDRQYFIDKDGNRYEVDNKNVVLDYSRNEKEVAEWLENTFGGEIYMLPRVNQPDGIMTADYLWNNEYWDLKEIVGNAKHTLDSAIKKKKSQSTNFIFDVTNSKINANSINNQLKLVYKSKDRKWVDKVIVKRNNEVIVIYKRK